MKSMYVGITGMNSAQQALTATSNNIANNQTNGYKAQLVEFEELMYQQYRAAVAPRDTTAGFNPIEVGNGTKVGAITTDFTQGNVKYTGKKLDLSIEGNGFFILGDKEGSVTDRLYTRDGGFKLSSTGEIQSKSGHFLLGWNADENTGKITPGGIVEPIRLDLGKVSKAQTSTEVNYKGNLDLGMEPGDSYRITSPSWDKLGTRFDINTEFVKEINGNPTYEDGRMFNYITTVDGEFYQPTAAVEKVDLDMSVAASRQFAAGGTRDYYLRSHIIGGGGVNAANVQWQLYRVNPGGAADTLIFTDETTNADQTVTLKDASGNTYFTVDMQKHTNTGWASGINTPISIAEAGSIRFDETGQVKTVTGSDVMIGGPVTSQPIAKFTSTTANQDLNISLNFEKFTALDVNSDIQMENTDGHGAAVLQDYSITDGGAVFGYFDDGTSRMIASVAVASFVNPAGLSRVGQGNFRETANSSFAEIGLPETAVRGQIKAQAVEASNVDLAKEFVDLMINQKSFQANTKVIRTSDEMLADVINLIR